MFFANAYFWVLVVFVIGGHVVFAAVQMSPAGWARLCRRITQLKTDDEIGKTAFLGRSIGSYNASIAAGLALSFLLEDTAQAQVQGAVLLFIVATAAVGAMGTKGAGILLLRLAPAAIAFALLLASLFLGGQTA